MMRYARLLALLIQTAAALVFLALVFQPIPRGQEQKETPPPMAMIGKDLAPVSDFARWKTLRENEPHLVFSVLVDGIAYQQGYRYIAVPIKDADAMRAIGAVLVAGVEHKEGRL